MVQFAENLEGNRVPEWHSYYVNYVRLKGWIKELDTSGSQAAAQQFFQELTLSFDRVEGFYNSKENALAAALETKLYKTSPQEQDGEIANLEKEIDKLTNYATMNAEALRKIAKKFDKSAGYGESGEGSGNHASLGNSSDWGVLAERLQPRILARLPNYRFGNASLRLGALAQKIEEWKSGVNVSLKMEELKAPLVRSGLSMLDESMMVRQKAKPNIIPEGIRSNYKSLVWISMVSGCLTISAVKSVAADSLNAESYVVVWVTVIALTLLVMQWGSHSVMLGATLFLNLCGLIDSKEAWGGFSNEVVLSVAALSVVGDIVSRTGFVDILFAQIIGQPQSLGIAMIKILVLCAIGAATISNTAVMACCMPAVEEWCSRSGYHHALFLMPISYIMLIAGTFAIFSTSTNLVAQALLVEHGLPPLATFELAVPSLACFCVALVYLIVATPIVLGRFRKKSNDDNGDAKDQSGIRSWLCHVQVSSQSIQGKSLLQSGLLEALEALPSNVPGSDAGVVEVERYGIALQPSPDCKLQLDDVIGVQVRSCWIDQIADLPGFQLLPLGASEVSYVWEGREFAEVCLDRGSPLVGQRLAEAKSYSAFGGSIVARRIRKSTKHHRDENVCQGSVTCKSQVIAHGDQFIIDVPAGFCKRMGTHSAHFLAIRRLGQGGQKADTFTAYLSGAILCVMLAFIAFSIFPLFPSALAGVFVLVMTGCGTVEDAKKAVPLKVVLTIVGAFGLGNALGKHGVAIFLGSGLVSAFAPFGHAGLLVAVAVAVTALGVIFHGTAVVALMFPMCVHVAQSSGIPIHQMVAVLCFSVACQMLSPVSYNTNLMAYAACPDYEFRDFPALGGPLVILILLVSIPMCLIWFQ